MYYEQAGDVNGRKIGVGPICVPKKGDRYSGMVTVAGWGQTENYGPGRKQNTPLRSVHLKLLNISHCKNESLQRDRVKPEEVKVPGDEEPQICAGYPQSIKGTCKVCRKY